MFVTDFVKSYMRASRVSSKINKHELNILLKKKKNDAVQKLRRKIIMENKAI